MRKKRYVFGFLILLSLCFSVDINGQSDYKLAEQDSLALVAFYWATDGPNWISNQDGFGFDNLSSEWQVTYFGKFNNWFDGPVKDWFGVNVEKRPITNSTDSIYRVTWLWPVIGRRTDGQNLLNGYVPREVGLLTGLEQFYVNGNDGFRDELIPDEIYHPSLKRFDTEAAWFGGGLSDAFRNCTDIRKINIRYNNYDYMPNLDFLGEEGVRKLEGSQWFYNSRFSYFYMERIVDFFYTISPNPMEFGFEARDMFDVGDVQEIVAPIGSSVEMICTEAGMKEEFITYQWFKDGLSKFGKKNKTYDFSAVKESDYGHYTTRITNDYVKSYDGNGNYGEVFTKGIYLVPEPVAPVIYKSVVENSGQFIDLYFSKRMTGATGFTGLTLTSEGENIAIKSATVRGRINRQVRLFLETPLKIGQTVMLSNSGSAILDKNGGILETFTDLEVENRTRQAPSIVDAITTLDGSGIIVNFDYFIDKNSFADASFTVVGSTNTYTVGTITSLAGKVNAGISKSILLTLNEEISDSAEIITIAYLEGKINGLHSGTLEASEEIPVRNTVTVDRTEVTLLFEDGTSEIGDVVIEGSWKATPIQLYDDGSNGDVTAGDHLWTITTALADDDYRWDVFSRETITVIDTVETIDSSGNTVLTLIEGSTIIDSLLNDGFILAFAVNEREISGDTIYGVANRDIIFNVRVDDQGEELYLMGINDDWNDGLLMEKKEENLFTVTVARKSAGDEINYNYRKGPSFENQTPDTRYYKVKNGENIINDEFGIFTSIEELATEEIKITPNPSADGYFIISNAEHFNNISVYDNIGILKKVITNQKQKIIYLDMSVEPPGIYYISGSNSLNGKLRTYKILIY